MKRNTRCDVDVDLGELRRSLPATCAVEGAQCQEADDPFLCDRHGYVERRGDANTPATMSSAGRKSSPLDLCDLVDGGDCLR